MKDKEELKYYDVKIEANVPAIFHYRILAKTPEEAESLIKYRSPVKIEYKPSRRKILMLKIYELKTAILHIAKSLL